MVCKRKKKYTRNKKKTSRHGVKERERHTEGEEGRKRGLGEKPEQKGANVN